MFVPPQPVKSGPFTYDGNGIKLADTPRASLHELKLLFRKNASRQRKKQATKPWVTAQLQLYGFQFEKSDSAIALKDMLESAVKSGKCKTPQPSMQALEASMEEEYQRRYAEKVQEFESWKDRIFKTDARSPTEEAQLDISRFMAKYFVDGNGNPCPGKRREPLILGAVDKDKLGNAVRAVPGLAVHITDLTTVVGWETTIESGIDEVFAGLSSPGNSFDIPTKEANYDIDRFLAKYFLDEINGNPAPRKTPDPIRLLPFFKNQILLRNCVAQIPGLYICDAYGTYDRNTIIGFSHSKVQALKHQIEDERERNEAEAAANERARKEEIFQRMLVPHYEYMETYQAPPGPVQLNQLTGEYLVKCEKLDGGDDYCRGKRLHIHPASPRSQHGVMAAFEFDMLTGTMLLAMSNDAVHRLRKDVNDIKDIDGYSDYDSGSGTENMYVPKQNPKANTSSIAINRTQGETPRPNRIYLQWTGRVTDAEIEADPENKHTGYIDIDESKATGHGEFMYPAYFGSESVSFSIYKISDRPSQVPVAWARFSGRQYDHECSSRWGRWG